MPTSDFSIIIPEAVFPLPSAQEISAARILTGYFCCNIIFVPRTNHKTPDFLIKDQYWELKTPTGNGKYTLQHAIHAATSQSANIIIDVRFSKIHSNQINSILQREMNLTKSIKQLILIQKDEKIIDFQKQKW